MLWGGTAKDGDISTSRSVTLALLLIQQARHHHCQGNSSYSSDILVAASGMDQRRSVCSSDISTSGGGYVSCPMHICFESKDFADYHLFLVLAASQNPGETSFKI